MQECRISLGDLKEYITKALKRPDIDESLVITWADMIDERDTYYQRTEYPPGTIMFGTEKIEDGDVIEGILYFTPKRSSKFLS